MNNAGCSSASNFWQADGNRCHRVSFGLPLIGALVFVLLNFSLEPVNEIDGAQDLLLNFRRLSVFPYIPRLVELTISPVLACL
jgi:hypothetical protein